MGKVQKLSTSIDHRLKKDKESMDYRWVYESDNSSRSQLIQRAIAEKLLQRLGEPRSWKFYLKCAYHLPEAKIWNFVALAMRPGIDSPNRYFVALANREMNK